MTLSLLALIRFWLVLKNEFARLIYIYEVSTRCIRSSLVPQEPCAEAASSRHPPHRRHESSMCAIYTVNPLTPPRAMVSGGVIFFGWGGFHSLWGRFPPFKSSHLVSWDKSLKTAVCPTLTFPPSSVTLFSINRIISAVSAVVSLSLARPPQHPRTSEEKEYREF